MLVIGSIHGDETAGHEIIARLRARARGHQELVLLKTINPDGVASGERQNARGVDLNRNFPVDWRPGARSSGYYPGRKPFSEPESRALRELVRQMDPAVVIVYHQPWDRVLGPCESQARLERRYARLVDMEFACRPELHGTATEWMNRKPGLRAFVVELPAGVLTRSAAAEHAQAVMKVAHAR